MSTRLNYTIYGREVAGRLFSVKIVSLQLLITALVQKLALRGKIYVNHGVTSFKYCY